MRERSEVSGGVRWATDANLSHEHVVRGDETGVQGRLESNVGRIVSAVFKAMNVPITLAKVTIRLAKGQRAKAKNTCNISLVSKTCMHSYSTYISRLT